MCHGLVERGGNLQAPLSHLPFRVLLFSIQLSNNNPSPSAIVHLTSSQLKTHINFHICFCSRVCPCPYISSQPCVLISTRSVATNPWLLSSHQPNPSPYTPLI